ncbi:MULTISPECIES: PIN domain-containing protein [unclassified Brevundimonas]|nr:MULTISPECIES: PIN domain-containing protein [unclassified Brevundimonas]
MIILPDTNALLHFKRPDQANWKAIVGTSEVEIVLTAVPVQEIDKHARQHDVARIRARARDLKAWIRTLLTAEAGPSIDGREPTAFLVGGLDPQVPDDRLIAMALMLQSEGHEVAIYTDDTLIHAKSRGRPIRVIFPPEEDRLKEEPDPLGKEIEKLQRELTTIKAREPRLKLGWASGPNPLIISLPEPATVDARAPTEERERLQPLPDPGRPPPRDPNFKGRFDFAQIRQLSALGPSQIEVIGYNRQLENYHRSYDRYFKLLTEWNFTESRLAELVFIARNDGSAPASSFRAYITLPPGMQALNDADDIGDLPKAPCPPREPQAFGLSSGAYGATASAFPLASLMGPGGMVRPDALDDYPHVDAAAGIIELRRPKLPQHNPFVFEPAYVLIDSSFDGKGGALDVRLTAEELATPLTFKLPFRVNIQPEN